MFKTVAETITLIASFLVQHLLYRESPPIAFKPRCVLVIKLDHLGDVLLATPVLENLRCAYPSAQIHVLAGTWGAVGLENHPDINKIIHYNSRFFRRSGTTVVRSRVFATLDALRHQKYDLIVDLRGDWLTILYALLKPTRYRLDYAWLQIANKLGFARFSGLHEVDRNLDLLRSVNVPTPLRHPRFHTTPQEKLSVREQIT